MDHTVLHAITPNACLYLVSVHQMAPLQTEVAQCAYLIAAYYSFIYPERMKG